MLRFYKSQIGVGIHHNAQLLRAESRSPFGRKLPKGLVLAFVLITCAASQQLSAAVDSNAIMGFETPPAWIANGNAASDTMVSATTTRTQGSFAYALANPANLTTLTSMPVASTPRALAGLGNPGAIFEVDVMLPVQQGNP